ncbi:MAG: hypothetical protein OEX03_10555 [Gammaproteobacteria bacterium]|nr:hypothetical protein [Gammaproteobacteria bacterium]
MKLKRVIFMLLVTVSLGVQAADYKVAPGHAQSQSKAQNAKGQVQQSDKAKVQRERHMASKMEEKENGGASPPAIRRMPLNR